MNKIVQNHIINEYKLLVTRTKTDHTRSLVKLDLRELTSDYAKSEALIEVGYKAIVSRTFGD